MGYYSCMFEISGVFDILKWAALVFLAGFIGFFGKYLGRLVLGLFRNKDEVLNPPSETPTRESGSGTPGGTWKAAGPEGRVSKEELKLIKKALKEQAKAKKEPGS